MQVHVELRSEFRVQDTVDVLEMSATSEIVELVGLGTGSVEMTAATGSGLLSEHAFSGASHHLGQIHSLY